MGGQGHRTEGSSADGTQIAQASPPSTTGPSNAQQGQLLAPPAPGVCPDTPTLDLLNVLDEVGDFVMNGAYAVEHMFNPGYGLDGTATASQEASTKEGLFGDTELPEHEQQYSAHGVPLTADAWALQNQVDGGKFQGVHDRAMLDHFIGTGAVDASSLGDLEELSGDRIAELVDGARGEQSPEEYFASLDPEVAATLQTGMLDTYMEMANNDTDANFILEMLPTDTTNVSGGLFPSANLGPDGLPNEYRVGEEVGMMRHSSVSIADHLDPDGDREGVYGLVVPYSNTAANVLQRDGTPTDGSYNLHKYLRNIDQDVNTVATGYSQGGAAVLDYVERYGDVDGLDAAVALAPMGGSDRENLGSDGQYQGVLNDVPTFSATHSLDPAKDVYEDMSLPTESERDSDLMGRGMAFSNSENGAIHSGFDPAHPEQGTYGYPTDVLTPLIGGLLDGDYDCTPYERQGDWTHDRRP